MKTVRRPDKARKLLTTALEREEWFFGDVPPAEIESCFYYEYARINGPITDCVGHWRKKIGNDVEGAKTAALKSNNRDARGTAFRDALQELTPLIGRSYFVETAVFLLSRRCFPDAPWQLLGRADKAAWEKALNLYRYFDTQKGGLREIEIFRGNLEDFYRQQFERGKAAVESRNMPVEVVPFEIDWRSGVGRVIADFTTWARRRWTQVKYKKKPRALCYEWLKQLGVMRLKDKLCSWSKAQRYSEEVIGSPLYKDDENLWRRARLAAKERARKIFPITGLPTERDVK